uniref:hypothetical protein n=1 Tax=Amycolatopsis sp. CA-096443 TaxID=3239919 RepID=UPI003F4932BF
MTAQPGHRTDIRADPTPEHAALCGERLDPCPPDTEHDGWVCVRPAGHHAAGHRAADGTEW